MHWFDLLKDEVARSCDRDEYCYWPNCEWCDQFIDDVSSYLGMNERVDPYDYDTEEEYRKIVDFANEADFLMDAEGGHWLCGITPSSEFLQSAAVDPSDFSNYEDYKNVLAKHFYFCMKNEWPFVPDDPSICALFCDELFASASEVCARKVVLRHMEDELQDLLPMDTSYDETLKRCQLPSHKWVEEMCRFQLDALSAIEWNGQSSSSDGMSNLYAAFLRNHPELFPLLHWAIYIAPSETAANRQLAEALPTILRYALLHNDLLDFDLDDAIQNGFLGAWTAGRDPFWHRHSGYDEFKYHLEEAVCTAIIENSLEMQELFGDVVTKKAASVISHILDTCMWDAEEYHKNEQWDYNEDHRYFDYRQLRTNHMFRYGWRVTTDVDTLSEDVGILTLYEVEAEKGEQRAMCQKVHELLQRLTARDRQVLELRYGLNGHEPLSLEMVGEILNISRERVRQIEARAIERLRRKVKTYNPLE